MKKKIVALVIVYMFLLTGSAALSAAGTKVEITNDAEKAVVKGCVKNKFGWVCITANVEVRIGLDPESSEYVILAPVNYRGKYLYELDADEEGTTYWVRAITISIHCDGDSSEWDGITVFPGRTYKLPDLILLHTPKTKAFDTKFLRFLENHPRIFPILRQLLSL